MQEKGLARYFRANHPARWIKAAYPPVSNTENLVFYRKKRKYAQCGGFLLLSSSQRAEIFSFY